MKSATTRTARHLAGAVLLAAAPLRYCMAGDADCRQLFDAMAKLYGTPSHQYLKQTTASTGGKTTASEIINTGKAMYIMVDGKWHNSNATGELLEKQEEDNRKKAKLTTCTLVREESVDGVKAKLFSAHTETEYGASDEQMWIATSNGLPVREVIDMDMGDNGGKSRAEITVAYRGVEAPAVGQ